jgi:hypothetical protein
MVYSTGMIHGLCQIVHEPQIWLVHGSDIVSTQMYQGAGTRALMEIGQYSRKPESAEKSIPNTQDGFLDRISFAVVPNTTDHLILNHEDFENVLYLSYQRCNVTNIRESIPNTTKQLILHKIEIDEENNIIRATVKDEEKTKVLGRV